MKLVIVLCLVALGVAAPPPINYSNNDVELLRYENNNDGLGNYNYGFEQSDGTKQNQQGELKNVGSEDVALVIKGSYSWRAPNGVIYIVTYVADEKGYQPEIEEEAPGGASPALVASLIG